MKLTGERVQKAHVATQAAIASVIVLMLIRIILTRNTTSLGGGIISGPLDLLLIAFSFLCFGLEHALSGATRALAGQRRYKDAVTTAKGLILKGMIIGAAAGCLVILGSFFLRDALFTYSISFLSYCTIGIAIVLMSVTGGISGYLQGLGFKAVGLLSYIIFDLVSLLVALIASGSLSAYGEKVGRLLLRDDPAAGYGAFGGSLGFLAGAACMLICLIVLQSLRAAKIREFTRTGEQDARGEMLGVSRMAIYFGFVFGLPFILQLSDEIIYRSMAARNHVKGDIISNWGMYSGMVMPFEWMIMGIAIIICLPGVYSLCASIAHKDKQEAASGILRGSRLLMTGLIPCSIFTMILAASILKGIFRTPSDDVVAIVKYCAPLIVTIPAAFLSNSILLRLRAFRAVLINLLTGALVHYIFAFVLSGPLKAEIAFAPLSQSICFALIALMAYIEISGMLRARPSIVRVILVPLVCSLVAGLAVFGLDLFLPELIGEVLTILVCAVIGGFLYILFMLIMRGIDEYEVESIPGASFIVLIARGFHLI
ncbi:polysaccharide biosynthesis C-terminal domain-containing protein [Butyrivibrio sp. MC2013]|uniref:polysaccharide biosynthesis C-terminal domain-containing protein n=1 Tax=Butyrivibrio sp. MC2013 TaxID=1280686 RepID=UPI000400A88A|nr:polysaccharide biosynthesis C-terminal domain-containing protein [Butyrivibrio sp. MC2013]